MDDYYDNGPGSVAFNAKMAKEDNDYKAKRLQKEWDKDKQIEQLEKENTQLQAEIDKVMNEVYMRREETKKLRKTIREFNKHRR